MLPKDAADEQSAILEVGPAPAATRRPCSRPICSACTSAMPKCMDGRSRSSPSRRTISAATRKSSPRSWARACSPGSSSKAACIACSAFRPPKRRAHPHVGCNGRGAAGSRGHRHRHQTTRTSASIRCARAGPAVSTSTRRTVAVRITHMPTGIVVVSAEKSQHQNRRLAMQVLRSRLFDYERERADSERSQARKSQVGSGDRSQRIRTYNYPQGRVTDHRINLTLHNIERVMEGSGSMRSSISSSPSIRPASSRPWKAMGVKREAEEFAGLAVRDVLRRLTLRLEGFRDRISARVDARRLVAAALGGSTIDLLRDPDRRSRRARPIFSKAMRSGGSTMSRCRAFWAGGFFRRAIHRHRAPRSIRGPARRP